MIHNNLCSNEIKKLEITARLDIRPFLNEIDEIEKDIRKITERVYKLSDKLKDFKILS